MADTDVIPGTAATPEDETFTPPDGSYADHWKGKMTNSPNAPGFDPNKVTSYEDQFGEVSVTDTNDVGRAPAQPELPPEEQKFLSGKYAGFAIQARQQGYSWDEVNQYMAGKVKTFQAQARGAGYSEAEIGDYLGLSDAQSKSLTDLLDQNVRDHYAANPPDPAKVEDNPAQAFWDGITHGSIAIGVQTALGKPPTTLPHEETNLANQIAQGMGTFVAGQWQAMTAGELAGSRFGVAGALVGAGLGLIADASVRNAAAIAITKGTAKDPQDLAVKFVTSWWKGTVEAAPVIAGMAVAGPAGALAAKAGAGPIAQGGARLGSSLIAMTAAASAISGEVPTMQNWVDGAIALGAFEILGRGGRSLGRAVETKPGTKPTEVNPILPDETVNKAMGDIIDNYALNGERPEDVAPRVARETSLEGLTAKEEDQGGLLEPAAKAEIEKAWNDQGIDDFSPAVRARWYATAVDDGVKAANDILEKSGGFPDRFNDIRHQTLLDEFNDDPKAFGGDLDRYMQRLDSRPPTAPEKVAERVNEAKRPASEYVKQISEPIGKPFRGDLEDQLHTLTTSAQADDINMRALVRKMPEQMAQPPTDKSYKTLDEKFDAHMRGETTAVLTPAEQLIYDQHVKPLENLRDALVKKVEGFITEGEGDADITGGANPIPFLNRKGLSRIQKGTANSAVANLAESITKLTATVRWKELSDAIKESDTFASHSVQAGEDVIPPKGYMKMGPGPFAGFWVDPAIGEPIKDFLQGGPKALDIKALETVNKLSISALFALPDGILAHGRNLIETWLPARGWDNLSKNPQFGRALKEVNTLGPEYIKVLRHGGSLISSGIQPDNLISFVMKKMGQDIAVNEAQWGPVARALGFKTAANLGGKWQRFMSKELYRFGDYLYMQRYLELRDKGYTTERAIKETELFMPTYRMPSRVLNQRWIAQALGSINITAFGRYEISKYRALANGVKTLVDPKASGQQRVDAVGRLFVATMMMTAGQYMMNSFVQHITGNDQAEFLWGGPLGIVQKGAKAILSPSQDNFNRLLRTMFNPAPGTAEILQQVFGKDFFTGNDIAADSAPPKQQAAERLNHALKGLNVANVGELATDWEAYFGSAVGLSNPGSGAAYYKATQGLTRVGNHWVPDKYLQARKDPPWVQFLSGAP